MCQKLKTSWNPTRYSSVLKCYLKQNNLRCTQNFRAVFFISFKMMYRKYVQGVQWKDFQKVPWRAGVTLMEAILRLPMANSQFRMQYHPMTGNSCYPGQPRSPSDTWPQHLSHWISQWGEKIGERNLGRNDCNFSATPHRDVESIFHWACD